MVLIPSRRPRDEDNYHILRFESTPEYSTGGVEQRLVSLTLRPILNGAGGYDSIPSIRNLARTFVDRIHTDIQELVGWTRQEMSRNLITYLTANNIQNATTKGYEKDIRPFTVNHLEHVIGELLRRIQNSNLTIRLVDIEWTITINPMSFIRGAGKHFIPGWAPKRKFKRTWDTHEGVSCAGIIFCLHKHTH